MPRDEILKQEIAEAIRYRRILKFEYNGHKRTVEPYTLGISKKETCNLSAYQTEGSSASNQVPDWKLFSIKKIRNIQVTQSIFNEIRREYRPGDSRMEEIIIEVKLE